ncbi:unnamed protein product [Urochloa humidicola]
MSRKNMVTPSALCCPTCDFLQPPRRRGEGQITLETQRSMLSPTHIDVSTNPLLMGEGRSNGQSACKAHQLLDVTGGY